MVQGTLYGRRDMPEFLVEHGGVFTYVKPGLYSMGDFDNERHAVRLITSLGDDRRYISLLFTDDPENKTDGVMACVCKALIEHEQYVVSGVRGKTGRLYDLTDPFEVYERRGRDGTTSPEL